MINHNGISVHRPTLTLYIFLYPVSYPSMLLVNHICSTVFKLLYINISKESPYFRFPDEERFYPFEILLNATQFQIHFHIELHFHIHFYIQYFVFYLDYVLILGNFTHIPQIYTPKATILAKEKFRKTKFGPL